MATFGWRRDEIQDRSKIELHAGNILTITIGKSAARLSLVAFWPA